MSIIKIYNKTIQYNPEEVGFPFDTGSSQDFSLLVASRKSVVKKVL